MDEVRRAFGHGLQGSQRYSDHDERRPEDRNPRIYAQVKVEGTRVQAMIDTGAQYCVVPGVGPTAGNEDPRLTLDIRGYPFHGRVTRAPLVILADSGPDVSIDAVFFVPDPEYLQEGPWPHPFFVGLNGALHSLYLGIDPSRSLIHFGLR